MALSDINAVITSMATAGGVAIVRADKATLLRGRAATPTATLTLVDDVVHHPGKVSNARGRGTIGTSGAHVFYFREAVLPAVIDPSGKEPTRIIADGVFYVVDEVEAWKAGGFWVVRATREEQTRAMTPVWFGVMPPGGITDLPAVKVVFEQALIDTNVLQPAAASLASALTADLTSEDVRAALVTVTPFLSANSSDGSFSADDLEYVMEAFDTATAPGIPFDPATPRAYSPSRSFRFALTQAQLGVSQDGQTPIRLFVAWPSTIEQPDDDPVILQEAAGQMFTTDPDDVLTLSYTEDDVVYTVLSFLLSQDVNNNGTRSEVV
jgi:hypothetical protein